MSARNTLTLLGITAAFSLVAPSPVIAAPDEAGIVVVHGDGEVHVAPDSFRIDVGVEARATTIEKVQKQVATTMQAIITALEALDVDGLTLETKVVQLSPVYGPRREDQPPAIIGYTATAHVQVTVRGAPVSELGGRGSRILEAALNAGANSVGGLDFFLSDPDPAAQDALTAAMQSAQRDAETIASTAGITLDGLYSVVEEQGVRMAPRTIAPEAIMATPIEPEDVVFQSSVTARYRFH